MNDQCPSCGAAGVPITMPHAQVRGTEVAVFLNVPASMCRSCGGVWLDDGALEKIDQMLASPEGPQRMVPAWDFALVS